MAPLTAEAEGLLHLVGGSISETDARLERLVAYARANPTVGVDRALALVATKLDEAALWLDHAEGKMRYGAPL